MGKPHYLPRPILRPYSVTLRAPARAASLEPLPRGRPQTQGGMMDQARLAALLVARGDVERHACVQLSATKFVPAEQWARLKRHEQEFLRCYAAGVSAVSYTHLTLPTICSV